MTEQEFKEALASRHGREVQEILNKSTVGIAGLGGLGSNIAYHFARLGVGKLILADYDQVDAANLNRQQYLLADVGRFKGEALREGIARVNPWCVCQVYCCRVTPENVKEMFQECDVLCEAFDRAKEKAMLLEQVLLQMPGKPLVSGNGMAGFGSANEIKTKKWRDKIYICGDGESDVAKEEGLVSPRVAVCAAQEAHMALRLLLGYTNP